ncbi:hypothetical protein MCUN1_001380 [Malassezia cuniculi]|uniref:Protein kinase domain-containing protein n=1 Tax=Malassezia cuniculi TaxID=948313 RepID=A0AAF0ESY3_9BASI|nr:hypothetical protein MCUN1_001380 [Malassezia cuniculi]
MSHGEAADRFRSWLSKLSKNESLLPKEMAAKYSITSESLGSGAFGAVVLCTERESGEKRACKIIAKPALLSPGDKSAAVGRVRLAHEKQVLLSGLDNPNILSPLDLFESDEALFLITEFCAGGQLFDHIVARGAYSENDARAILRQLLSAVAYLHEHNIVHRDIKPENILLRSDNDTSNILLSDFGLAQVIKSEMLLSASGSPQYIAPEVLLGVGYGRRVDVWSCGIVAYALLCGYTPFNGKDVHDTFEKIIARKIEFADEFWSDKSDGAKEFIRKCLSKKEQRFSAAEALKDPWLTATDGSQSEPQASANRPKLTHSKTELNIDLSALSGTKYYIREKPKRRHSQSQTETMTTQALDRLLRQYGSSALPDHSRIDPSVPPRAEQAFSLTTILKSIPALLNQSLAIGSTIANHALYGPPKKSWGVEMSVITRTVREFAMKNTNLTTMSGLQMIFDLARFLPQPEDGLITPVTFRIKSRGLPGFLADEDKKEDGKRELTGEWVVGKQVWRRLQSEWQSGRKTGCERVILYIHGGAYILMSATVYRALTITLSKYTECRVFCPNYRLAPDAQFPGPLLDVVNSWLRLTEDLKIPPNNVVLAADSAGGGLALALMLYLRDNKMPMPGGAILFSPWVDLTLSCDSWETNAAFDYLPRPENGDHMNPVSAYLGENMDKYITHPYVSPLFGDMHGLPPLLIQCGDSEVLRDEDILLAHKCSLAGVPVRHEIYEDCVHVFQFFLFLDASRKALQSARHFMRTALNKVPKRQPTIVEQGTMEQLNSEIKSGMGNVQGNKVDPDTGKERSASASVEPAINSTEIEDPDDDDEPDWDLDMQRKDKDGDLQTETIPST